MSLSQIYYEAMQIVGGLIEGKLDGWKPLKVAGGTLLARLSAWSQAGSLSAKQSVWSFLAYRSRTKWTRVNTGTRWKEKPRAIPRLDQNGFFPVIRKEWVFLEIYIRWKHTTRLNTGHIHWFQKPTPMYTIKFTIFKVHFQVLGNIQVLMKPWYLIARSWHGWTLWINPRLAYLRTSSFFTGLYLSLQFDNLSVTSLSTPGQKQDQTGV